MGAFGFKQFKSEGCASYVVWCLSAREALVVDPRAELMDDYREYLGSRGLKPAWVVDTQTHDGHFSASHLFRSQFGAVIGMSHRTESKRPSRKFQSGDLVKLGALNFQVHETPGVAPDALSVYGHGLVFTGHTAAVGSLGRTDLPGADAGQLWDSVQGVLGKLPGTTLIYPARYGNDLLFSTIEVERRSSPEWQMKDRDAFVEYRRENSPSIPAAQLSDDVRMHLDFNRQATPATVPEIGFLRPIPAPAVVMPQEPGMIGIAKYAPKLKEQATGSLFIDVREPEEFGEGRMPGVRNIPLSELGMHLTELSSAKRIYVSCLAGPRSSAASKTLSYLGLMDVVNVTGGFRAWVSSGFPVEKPQA